MSSAGRWPCQRLLSRATGAPSCAAVVACLRMKTPTGRCLAGLALHAHPLTAQLAAYPHSPCCAACCWDVKAYRPCRLLPESMRICMQWLSSASVFAATWVDSGCCQAPASTAACCTDLDCFRCSSGLLRVGPDGMGCTGAVKALGTPVRCQHGRQLPSAAPQSQHPRLLACI